MGLWDRAAPCHAEPLLGLNSSAIPLYLLHLHLSKTTKKEDGRSSVAHPISR